MRCRVLAAAALAAVATVPAASASTNPAAHLVLTQKDVGRGYVNNAGFSHADSLRELSTGASPAVKRELAEKWRAGIIRGFSGITATDSLVSSADVFRTPKLDLIVRSLERRYLLLSRGRLRRLPPGAPGTHRYLIRGKMRSFATLIYIWQRGAAIMTVWQIATPAALRPHQLFVLARRQDAKAR
jgi:hypothetical protein